MKKFLKSRKGFSLIELVIVIAILGVLAAVSITMFPRIAGTGRTNADLTQQNNIQSAIATYIQESGDTGLTHINTIQPNAALPAVADALNHVAISGAAAASVAEARSLVAAFQKPIFSDATFAATTKRFGPYMSCKHPAALAADLDATIINDYRPQGDGMGGWAISVNRATGNVTVDPAATYSFAFIN